MINESPQLYFMIRLIVGLLNFWKGEKGIPQFPRAQGDISSFLLLSK